MKNNLWAKVFFGFFACISLASAANPEEDKVTLKSNWPEVWKKGDFHFEPKKGLTFIGGPAALSLGKQKVLGMFQYHTSAELRSLQNAIRNQPGFMGNGMYSSIGAAIEEREKEEQSKKQEQGWEHPEHRHPEYRHPEQTNIQFETPRPAQKTYLKPQDQFIQPPKMEIKGKLFGDLVKNKIHHDLFSNSSPTQLLYDMLKKLGFTSDAVKGSSRQYLINSLIKLYDISSIESALKDLDNAGYTATDDGFEAVHGVQNFLQDTVKMYQSLNRVQKNDELKAVNQEISAQNSPELQDRITPQGSNEPQENPQDIQPQENPQDIQPQGIQPQENPQDIQPQVRKIKGKLFGDLIKNKNHHDLLKRKTLSNGAGFTEVPTQLLYDMLKKLGFNSDAVKANSKEDLIKNIINLYDLSGIEGALKDLNNADEGGEAVFKLQEILEDTIKTYKEISDKESNPLEKKYQLKVETQDDITPQGSNDPQDDSTPQGEELQIKTAIDAAELRKKLLKKLNTKEKRQWNKIMKNTAKEDGVKEKSVSEAYSVLMNPKSQDSTIAKISDEAINVLIKSQVLFSLSNPVKVNLRTVVKKTKAGEKETQKLLDCLEEKIDVVKNGVDYGVEIDENTVYAIMSMFGLKETKTDKLIKEGIANNINYDELNKNIKVDDTDIFAENFTTVMKEAADECKGLKGSQQSRLRYVTNILGAMETAAAA